MYRCDHKSRHLFYVKPLNKMYNIIVYFNINFFFIRCGFHVQVRSLEEEIEKEKEELNKSKIAQEASTRKLKTELSGTKQKLQETEVCPVSFT